MFGSDSGDAQSKESRRMKVSRSAAPAVSLLIVAFVLSIAGEAGADMLLTIDATNPSDTIFDATNGLSAVTNDNKGYSLLLENTGISDTQNEFYDLNGNLGPAEGGGYGEIFTHSGSGTPNLNGGNFQQDFTQGQTALTGESTVDLSSLTFPTTDVIGNIDLRDNFGGDTGIVIGQYKLIVPEPASLGLLTFGGLAMLHRRPRRTPT
jgi:hypothetical protein